MLKRSWHAGLTLLLLAGASAQADSTGLETARSTLTKWVETRQLISRTRADWQADKETLQQTVAMFEVEIASLAEQSQTVGTNTAEVARQRVETGARKVDLEAGMAAVAAVLPPLETRLRKLSPVFPAPLLKSVQSLLDRLPENPAETELSPLQRLQTVITLMNEVEKFNSMVTLNPEMRADPAGGEIKVQVLYLGLGQAWFVDESADFAGVGSPGADGWIWTPRADLGSRVKRVIAMYEEKQPAEFVALPVEIR